MWFLIVGCFNVGKFFLFNCLVGEEWMFMGFEVGIIWDVVSVDWNWDGYFVKLFDIVGLCKLVCVKDKFEKLLVGDILNVVCFFEVVIFVMDVECFFEK